jgi:hypothetical protein
MVILKATLLLEGHKRVLELLSNWLSLLENLSLCVFAIVLKPM